MSFSVFGDGPRAHAAHAMSELYLKLPLFSAARLTASSATSGYRSRVPRSALGRKRSITALRVLTQAKPTEASTRHLSRPCLRALSEAMAAEYSRELSAKVFRAQCRLTEAGFKQGGLAGYGLPRMVISATGQPEGHLSTEAPLPGTGCGASPVT